MSQHHQTAKSSADPQSTAEQHQPTASAESLQPVGNQLSANQRPISLQESMVAAMYVDQAEKKRRESTFIISGLEGDQSGDRALVSDLCSTEFDLSLDIVSTKRLGQPRPGRVQPLLVVCRQAEQAQRLITDAKRLRNSTSLAVRERVYINRNLTKAEAEAAYRLRQQRRRAATSRPSVTVKPPAVQSDVDTTLSLLNMACNPTTSVQLLSSMPSGVGLSSFLSATNQATTQPSPLADNNLQSSNKTIQLSSDAAPPTTNSNTQTQPTATRRH
jgi:hypothetical protein